MKLQEVLMGPQIYGKMKDLFLDLTSKKNKVPKFKEFYDNLKKENPSIKTNMETLRKKSQIHDIEHQKSKYEEYKDVYNYLVKQYKQGDLRR